MPTSDYSNIILYGKGIFTTIAIHGSEPFLWEKHWRRLVRDAAKVGLDISVHNEHSVFDSVIAAAEKSERETGRVRVSFVDESASELWGGSDEGQVSLSLIAAEKRKPVENLRISISPYPVNPTSPLAGVKSCNYLEQILALEQAKGGGFKEAIRLNMRGKVTSGCMANVFWLKGEQLFTPSLETGCLAGTTREFILENLECEQVEAGVEALREADEIFLTSAGIGVVQAAEFDGRKLRGVGHPILNILPF